MVTLDEFDSFLNSILTDEDKQKIDKRKRKKRISIVVLISISVVLLSLAVAGFLLAKSVVFIGLILFLILAVLVLGWVAASSQTSETQKYVFKKYKTEIVEFLIGDSFEHSYYPKKGLTKEEFKNLKICSSFDDLIGEDLLKLKVNISNNENVVLTLSDVRATETHRNRDGETETTTVFSGIAGYAVFPFKFTCKLAINSAYHFKFRELSKFKLEDIRFNRRFALRSDNQFEATHILTPKLMEILMRIEKHFKHFGLILDDNKMIIRIPSQQLFVPKYYKDGDFVKCFYSFYEDIVSLTEIVKSIVLNKRIINQK